MHFNLQLFLSYHNVRCVFVITTKAITIAIAITAVINYERNRLKDHRRVNVNN